MKDIIDHSSRSHFELGGSSAHIYTKCSGSVFLKRNIPNEASSEHALEGTLFHEICEKRLHDFLEHKVTGSDPDIRLKEIQQTEGVNDEMLDYMENYVEAVWEKGLDSHITGKGYGFEDVMMLSDTPPIGGPVDFWSVWKDTKGLRAGLIEDVKYGYKYVDVSKNAQLACYAVSLRKEFRKLGKELDYIRVAIYQPRAGGEAWREDKLSKTQLDFWEQKFLRTANEIYVKKNPKFKAGDHCYWCKAKAVCNTHKAYLEKEAAFALTSPVTTTLPAIPLLSDSQLEKLLIFKDEITAYLKECYSYALNRVRAGNPLPNFKMVQGTAKRKWKKETEEIGALLFAEGLGEPFRPVEQELKTITEIEKSLIKILGNKESAKELLAKVTVLGTVPEILVPMDDPREPQKSLIDLLE